MKQIYAWFSDASRATKKFAVDTYTQIKYTSNIVYSSLNYDNASSSFVDAWRGFTVPLRIDLTVPALWESPQLREVSKQVMFYNLIYLGKVLTYQMSKMAVYSVMPGAEGSYAEMAMDAVATAYFISEAIQMFPRNIISTTNANKATENYYNNKPIFKGTKGKEIDAQQAHYTSFIYHFAKISLAKIVEWSPLPFAYIPASAIRIMAYGQALIEHDLELKTLQERSEIRAANNAFLGGLGFSYFMMVNSFRFGIYYFTGANNLFVYDAVAGLFYPGFVVATRLIDKPLPGKEAGLNLFYYTDYLTEAIIRNSNDIVMKRLNDSNGGIDWRKYKNAIQHFPPYELVTWIFFPREMLSIRRFARTPPMQLFWSLKADEIRAFLKMLEDKRESLLINFVNNWVPSWMLSEEDRKNLGILFAEHTAEVIAGVKEFIKQAQEKQKEQPLPVQTSEPIVTEYEPNVTFIDDVSSSVSPTVQMLEETVTVEDYSYGMPSSVIIEELSEEEANKLSQKLEQEAGAAKNAIIIDGNNITIDEDWVSIKQNSSPPVFHKQSLFHRANAASSETSKTNEQQIKPYQSKIQYK